MQNNDLISRKALIEDLMNLDVVGGHKMYRKGCDHTLHGLVPEMVNAQPAVDAVVLPCKIGQTVWAIRRYHDKKCATFGIVSEIFFTKQMNLEIVVKNVARGEWGEKVFATREEAEAALANK